MALVEQRERSAAAICAEPSRLLSIGPETFDALTHRDPELGMVVYRNIARALSERLRAAQ
jgi:CRP-like cAMP-binding protein